MWSYTEIDGSNFKMQLPGLKLHHAEAISCIFYALTVTILYTKEVVGALKHKKVVFHFSSLAIFILYVEDEGIVRLVIADIFGKV